MSVDAVRSATGAVHAFDASLRERALTLCGLDASSWQTWTLLGAVDASAIGCTVCKSRLRRGYTRADRIAAVYRDPALRAWVLKHADQLEWLSGALQRSADGQIVSRGTGNPTTAVIEIEVVAVEPVATAQADAERHAFLERLGLSTK